MSPIPIQHQPAVDGPIVRLANLVVASFEAIVMVAIVIVPVLCGLLAAWWGGVFAFLVFTVLGWLTATAFLGGFIMLARILRTLQAIEERLGQAAPGEVLEKAP